MSARHRSQMQSTAKKTATHRDKASSTPSLPPTASTGPPGPQVPQKAGKRRDQQAAKAMGPPDMPVTAATSSRPQRQLKVDALAKKVWSAIAPGAGRKCANSANQTALDVPNLGDNDPNMQQPASKKRKGAVDIQTTGLGDATKAKHGQSAAVHAQSDAAPVNSTGSIAPAPARTRTGASRNVKAMPRVELSVNSDSAVESEDDVPLVRRVAVTANPPKASTKASKPESDKREPESRKPLTRSTRTAAQAKAPVESATEAADEADDVVESDASNSAEEYAPKEDDEAYSDEDELDDPLSEDLEELEAQLREEAPVWTKEKDDKLLPVLRRKQPKKPVDLQIQLEDEAPCGEEEQPSAGKSECSTSKTNLNQASQRQQLEQPVWKATDPTPNDDEDDFEPWGPVTYSIPAVEDGPWEENIGAADESDTHSDDGHPDSADFHPQAYEIKLPVTPGGVLSLKEQHEHIQDMIRHTFIRVESNLVFTNGFPDAVGRARFVYEAMRDSALDLGYRGLYRRLGQDASFARTLASLPNQRISTFRSNVKKHTDSAVIAFYGLQPGLAADKVEWLFDHLKYIYPVVHEPADKRNATWTKPYQNSAVASALRACFFTGPTAVGNRDEARFISSRPEMSLHASLSEWRTGVHKKRTFSADAFLDAYTEHVTLLTGIKTQNPRAYHTTMHRVYTEASGTVPPTANLANGSDALAYVDFAGMDVD